MTEREQIEALIAENKRIIAGAKGSIGRAEVAIIRYVDQLAALPPDNPDLSGWRPDKECDFYYVDSGLDVVCAVNYTGAFGRDPNVYQTRDDAERAAKRQRLHARLWQCYERLYGAEGWNRRDEFYWTVCIRDGVCPLISTGTPSLTEVPFESKQHAQWVMEQLQSEGLL